MVCKVLFIVEISPRRSRSGCYSFDVLFCFASSFFSPHLHTDHTYTENRVLKHTTAETVGYSFLGSAYFFCSNKSSFFCFKSCLYFFQSPNFSHILGLFFHYGVVQRFYKNIDYSKIVLLIIFY